MVFWWRENNLSLELECQYLKSIGLGIELWPTIQGLRECRFERRHWPRLQNATENMLVAMRSRDDNPTLEQWQEQIECASLLNAHIVTNLDSLGCRDISHPHAWDFAESIIDLANQYHIRLCLETGPLQTLLQLGQRFPTLWYCLDVGFANLDPEHSFQEYVDKLAPRIAHLHLTDNYGQRDDHEPPGLHGGIIRKHWDYLLEGLGRYNNDIIGSFEMCPCSPNAMIRQASEFIFDVLKWPNKPNKSRDYMDLAYNCI
jgi:sugar phosphate isomerase/epimerase